MILQTKSKDNKAVYELTVDLVEDAYRKRSLKIGMSTNQGTNIGMYICEASAKLLAEELNRFVNLISESPKEADPCDYDEEKQEPEEKESEGSSRWKWSVK